MKNSLLDYLNNPSDGNKLAFFLKEWFQTQSPTRSVDEIFHITNLFIQGLIHIPHIFDSRYQDYLQYALDQAQIESNITILSNKNGTILKYY
jgi:hypothetical protein